MSDPGVPDMTSGMTPFDPATMPLDGIRLIEASAGTGKTFSLAGLYLRLIVERRLEVEDILVMTFTRAATQELRERLRANLARAARVAGEPPDPAREEAAERFAEAVIASVAEVGVGEDRASIARRLCDAATRADQATITTIHGFAQRAAAENAFESALPFDRGEQIDDREVQREAATDYWRRRVFGADPQQANAFLALWPSPQALYDELREVLGKPHARLIQPDLAAVEREREAALAQWPAERPAFIECLSEALERDGLRAHEGLKATLDACGPEGLAERIDLGLAGTADGFASLPAVLADLGSDDGVRGQAKNAACEWFRPQDLAAVALLARLQVNGRLAAAAHAAREIHTLAAQRKRERREHSFDDMILALHAAVEDPQRGPALTQALRRTWPWALVDEFQDTDPLQYAILRQVYRPDPATAGDADERGGGLILIGDPKQAIYAFRGGDVFAYLDAAQDADGRYGMATNHRSTPAVVNGLDALFSAGGEQAFVIKGIRFLHVEPGRAVGDRQIMMPDGALAGVTAWSIPEDAGAAKGALQARIQSATVDRIAALLDSGRMLRHDGDERPLAPADMAVLVNTNRDATDMQAALIATGVPAVCIHQDSVFAGAAARDLLWLLQAVAAPLDAGRLRRALITPLFGLRLGDLIRAEADDADWSARIERFQGAHIDWGRSGVQAMLEPFLQEAAGRVLARSDGERRMTDYLHVAERLQQAEHEVFGREGLLRWLENAIDNSAEGEVVEADRIRLEDDSDLVQVTTVHKAKGLQWPLVFVPYAPWLGTGGFKKPPELPLVFHDDASRTVIDLGSSEAADNRPRAVREHKAEQIRSLYVAFTRAEEALFFVHGAAKQTLDGPLAWLLHHDDGVPADDWHGSKKLPTWFDAGRTHERLAQIQKVSQKASHGALALEALPGVDVPRQRRRPPAGELPAARSDFPPAPEPWSIFSFSRLSGRLGGAGEEIAGRSDEIETPPAADVHGADDSPRVIAWPRGAAFGQAFHEILEGADFAAWPTANASVNQAAERPIRAALRRHGIATELDTGRAPVEATAMLVAQALHTPLPKIGPLAQVPATRRRNEIEFFLRLDGGSVEILLERIAAAGYGGARQDSALPVLRGLMQGYIDLVVEVDERYWILDYKTNLLGPTRGAYAPARLRAAIAARHYDLQYLIYSVALHRHLRQRLPDYDPARRLGGVQYLFVRGMVPEGTQGDDANGIHVDRPAVALIEQLDALFDGREPPA